jgi:hypothetical protein
MSSISEDVSFNGVSCLLAESLGGLFLLSKYISAGFVELASFPFELSVDELASLAALDAVEDSPLELSDGELASLAALDAVEDSPLELSDGELASLGLVALAADELFDLDPSGGTPNLLSNVSPFLITQYTITGIPIMVNDNNCHQPDLPESCNLLVNTDIVGKKKTSVTIKLIGPLPIKELKRIASKIPVATYTRKVKREKYQYSDLRALPENSKYLEKTLPTASKNLI